MRLIDADSLVEAILEARREETDTIPKLIRFIRKRPSVEQKDEGLSVFEESVKADRSVCVYVPIEPKRGRWIKRNYRIGECSLCGYAIDDIFLADEENYPINPNYCPNCGAELEHEE